MKSIKKEKRLSRKEQIRERRYQFYRLMSRGMELADVVKAISEKYGVGKAVLYSDWAKRGEWGVVEEPEKDRIIKDALFTANETQRYQWSIVTASPENLNEDGVLVDATGRPTFPFELPNTKLRADTLARIIEEKFSTIRMTQSIGVVPQTGLTIYNLANDAKAIEELLAEFNCTPEETRTFLKMLDKLASGAVAEA